MRNIKVTIFVSVIMLTSSAQAGVFSSLLDREMEEKIQAVAPDIMSIIADGPKIAYMCNRYGGDPLTKLQNDLGVSQDGGFHAELASCCPAFTASLFAHSGGIVAEFLDPYQRSRSSLKKQSHESLRKHADEIAASLVKNAPQATPDQIREQTRFYWNEATRNCQIPLERIKNDSNFIK